MQQRVIADLMTTEFATCPVDEAAERETPPDLVVVVDEERNPHWVIGRAGPAPAVTMPATTPLDHVLEHDGIKRMLGRGLPAIVITDGQSVTGVVTGTVLYNELVSGAARRSLESDSELFGQSEPISSPVRIRCKRCRAWNSYDSYLPGDPAECVSGHPLEPEWT
jgi:hypothetical protein